MMHFGYRLVITGGAESAFDFFLRELKDNEFSSELPYSVEKLEQVRQSLLLRNNEQHPTSAHRLAHILKYNK
ncbi:MAG: hypothetical protein HQK53_07605 [Oligoflexia bacterium]|nr:hypothetical protein [Oligoflexia bacterium]